MTRKEPRTSSNDGVAIVTGCARGIGRAVCATLVEAGWKVVGVDEDAAAGAAAIEPWSDEAAFVPGDVAHRETAARAVETAQNRFGRLSGLVNNAGISNPVAGPLEDLEPDVWRRYLDVNLSGALWFMQAALPSLRQSKGAVVNVTSTRALQSEPNCEGYAAAKGGLLALTHAVAISAGPDVRVNAVAPGWIDTEGPDLSIARPDLRDVDHEQHPVGRVGAPRDVGAAVRWLLSDEASFVTGQQLVVDGGMTKKMIYAH